MTVVTRPDFFFFEDCQKELCLQVSFQLHYMKFPYYNSLLLFLNVCYVRHPCTIQGFPSTYHIILPSLFKIFKRTKVGGKKVKNKFILLSRISRLQVLRKAQLSCYEKTSIEDTEMLPNTHIPTLWFGLWYEIITAAHVNWCVDKKEQVFEFVSEGLTLSRAGKCSINLRCAHCPSVCLQLRGKQ